MANESFATLGVKLPSEKIFIDFNFTNLFNTGVTISTQVVTCVVDTHGTDAGASAMLSGSATKSGMVVSQLVMDGLPGVIYLLTCLATGSDGTKQAIQLKLPVEARRLG